MADRPVNEIRLGRVKAAIWRNESETGTWYSVAISRIYKTETGWESSTSFGRDELPLVAKVADLAHTWIYQQSPAEREKEEGEPKPPSEDSRSRQRTAAR